MFFLFVAGLHLDTGYLSGIFTRTATGMSVCVNSFTCVWVHVF
jgi:hypothetical protein